MRSDVFLDLMSMLNDCDADESAKDEFRKLIHNVAEANGVAVVERTDQRAERVEFARHLLKDLREARPTTRERLIDRFHVSRTQAYVDIGDALKLSSPDHRLLDALAK